MNFFIFLAKEEKLNIKKRNKHYYLEEDRTSIKITEEEKKILKDVKPLKLEDTKILLGSLRGEKR